MLVAQATLDVNSTVTTKLSSLTSKLVTRERVSWGERPSGGVDDETSKATTTPRFLQT